MQDHNWGRHHQVCQIYCANFVFHGMPVELVTQLAKFATKNPIAVIFTLWLSACCSLQRLNDSRPCLSKIHISKREPWHSARCLLKPGNTMMEYDVFPFIVHDGCAMCLLSFQSMHFDSVMTLRVNPWLSDSCPTCCIQVLGGTINPIAKTLLLPASLAHTGT